MTPRRDLHEANRLSWNTATRAHNSHKRDQAGFLRGGGSTLFPEEVELLGDLRGKTELHLQCHPYFAASTPLTFDEGVDDYVADAAGALSPSGHAVGEAAYRNPHPCHEFPWGVGDLLGAVLDAGLLLETYREYPFSNGCRLRPDMLPLPGNRFGSPDGVPPLPCMLGLAARQAPVRHSGPGVA